MTKSDIIEILQEEEVEEKVIKYYYDEIIKELKSCKITQKSVDEINVCEFKTFRKNYKGKHITEYILNVQVIYNGDFCHNFKIYKEK